VKLIWVTRGRTWGFRFLRRGGYEDPLPVYDSAFSGVEHESQTWRRVTKTAALPEMVALRFPDPMERRDQAGRVIPHDFVVFSPLAGEIDSVEDGFRLVWPHVADEFTRVFEEPKPPSADT
jgi:hypothetical protein